MVSNQQKPPVCRIPQRLIEGYHIAGLTLNFLRALADEGFADLHHPEQWELNFMKNNDYYNEYEAMVESIKKAVRFMDAIAPEKATTLQKSRPLHFARSIESLLRFGTNSASSS